MMQSINPTTGETLARFDPMSDSALEAALGLAATTFRTFGDRANLPQRLQALTALGEGLRAGKDALARMMTLEMGKPIAQAEAEIAKCADCCDHYVRHAGATMADRHIPTQHAQSYVRWLPMGPVLAVMPWNFPFWQVIRFAAPALASGNVCLLKHASNVPQCAKALEDLCRDAGFPAGAFQTLMIGSDRVERVIADDRVRAVTLTGSEAAGRAVAQAAGRALKPVVLELGGSDPFIVMPSADVEQAADTAVRARIQNNGQSCIAAKRFIIHADVFDAFSAAFVARMGALKLGDPLKRDTDVGPLATPAIRDELAEQVRRSVDMGARQLFQGDTPEGTGAWSPVIVLADPPEGSPAACEELFGPVATLMRVSSLDEAISLANATRFGLGAAAWTQDAGEQARLIDDIQAGFTAINGMTASDPRLPFGGVKASGFGRELSDLGMQAFLNAKTITVAGGKG